MVGLSQAESTLPATIAVLPWRIQRLASRLQADRVRRCGGAYSRSGLLFEAPGLNLAWNAGVRRGRRGTLGSFIRCRDGVVALLLRRSSSLGNRPAGIVMPTKGHSRQSRLTLAAAS